MRLKLLKLPKNGRVYTQVVLEDLILGHAGENNICSVFLKSGEILFNLEKKA